MAAKQKQTQAKSNKLKLKKGDEVIVIAGKDKGKRGNVISAIPAARKVIVEGINMVKKHVRPNPQRNIKGGIVAEEKALDISNVAIFNPETEKADRIGYKFLKDGEKVRIFKSNGEQLDTK